MRRRQTGRSIHFACIRLRALPKALADVPAALAFAAFALAALVPALHAQGSMSAGLPYSDDQAGLNGTGILASSGFAMGESIAAVNQTISATYSGSQSSAAGNTSLASLRLMAIASARRAVALAPGSGRISNKTIDAATHAAGEYAVAVHDSARHAPIDPMAELSQSIGPAYRQGRNPAYLSALESQPVAAIVDASDPESNLERIGGLQQISGFDRIGGLEKVGALGQGQFESFDSGFAASERLCGDNCGLFAASTSSNSTVRDRRKQNTAALQLKLQERLKKLDQLTTVSAGPKTGTN